VIEEDEKDDYNSEDYSDTEDDEETDSEDNETMAAVSQFLAVCFRFDYLSNSLLGH
jgi:hypothetical protein